jgi:predicted phosphodiesterase
MKIALASDVHLEFADLFIKNEQSADVLILAGDICVAKDALKQSDMGERVRNFFQRVSFQFPQVIYVMGNHEHYSGDFAKSAKEMQSMFDQLYLTNIKLLDKTVFELDDVTFIGGTLWTDMNAGDEITIWNAGRSMNDYHGVKNTASGHSGYSWKFTPEHSLHDHRQMMGYMKHVIDSRRQAGRTDARVVVVSHHAPTHVSIDDRFKHDTIMNGNFASMLDNFILDRPEIAVWVHGHMHNVSDYKVGNTRVICNPRGYKGYESRAEEFELVYFEV